jgi:hypothetical protein
MEAAAKRLAAPEVHDILEIAQVEEKPDVAVQRALLEALINCLSYEATALTIREEQAPSAQLLA